MSASDATANTLSENAHVASASIPIRARGSWLKSPLTTLVNGFEVSVHSVPPAFKSDLSGVLPGISLSGDDVNTENPPLLIVPTAQQSMIDLCEWGAGAAAEKDLLLERFAAWADVVCADLTRRGYWADSVDPCSGLARLTKHSHTPYPEVDAFETLLRWRTSNANGCKVSVGERRSHHLPTVRKNHLTLTHAAPHALSLPSALTASTMGISSLPSNSLCMCPTRCFTVFPRLCCRFRSFAGSRHALLMCTIIIKSVALALVSRSPNHLAHS
jgi:hypothetical protein